MSEIRVETGDLRSGSQTLNSVGGEASSAQSQLEGIASSVGNKYNGQLARAVGDIIGKGYQVASGLEGRAASLAHELLTRAQAFETVNQDGIDLINSASSQFTNFQNNSLILRILSFLSGKNVNNANFIWTASGLGGFGSLFGLITLFIGRGPSSAGNIYPGITNRVTKPAMTFGDLMQKEKQEEEAAQQWWQSNGLNQLFNVAKTMNKYNPDTKYAPNNGCGEANIAMLINYNNYQRGSTTPQITVQNLVNAAGTQGSLSPNSVGGSRLSWGEMQNLAESQSFKFTQPLGPDGAPHVNFYNLQQQVQSGTPYTVLVSYKQVGTNYVPDFTSKNYDHFVVVTNISNGKVTLINPLPNFSDKSNKTVSPETWTIDEFKQMWSGQGTGVQPN